MAADASTVAQVTEMVAVNGSGNPPWAIFVSAFAIILAALGGAVWQRRIARQNLTFNTLMEQLWDNDYIEQRQKFIRLRDENGGNELIKHAEPQNEGTDDAAAIRAMLNNYELLAVGIHEGVLDEALYRNYLCSTVVKDFERMKPYIDAIRKRDMARAYIEYEKLYERWREQAKS